MDEYVGCIRQRVLERMDLSREMSDEEIENLIGEEASRLMQEEPISIRERLMLEARVFNSLRKLDALQELLDDPEISEIMVIRYRPELLPPDQVRTCVGMCLKTE